MKLLAALLLVIVVVVAVQLLNRNAKRGNKSTVVYRYGRKDFFMNRAEHEFFDVLIEVVGSSYYIFPQVLRSLKPIRKEAPIVTRILRRTSPDPGVGSPVELSGRDTR